MRLYKQKSKYKKKALQATSSLAQAGVQSRLTQQVTSSFALVRALPMPPPAAKLPPRYRQAADNAVIYWKLQII